MYKRIETIDELKAVFTAYGYELRIEKIMTSRGEMLKLRVFNLHDTSDTILADALSTVGLQTNFQWNMGMIEAERVFGKATTDEPTNQCL